MIETRVAEFARRAEAAVELPDLSQIAARGRARRRRSHVLLGAAAAVALGVGSWAVASTDEPAVRPVEQPGSDAPAYPGSSDLQPLAPGTYEHVLAREVTTGSTRFTVPDGWSGWHGPNLPHLRDGYVGLWVGDVEGVARAACDVGTSPMRDVGDAVEPLVRALTRLPLLEVVDEPRATTFAGLDAVHLTLVGPRRDRCVGTLEVWESPGSGNVIPAPPRGTTLELWVVDLDGEAVLVSAATAPGTPDWAKEELASVVASLEIRRG